MIWDMTASMNMGSEMAMSIEVAMPDLRSWGIGDFVFIFVMWTVMQIAMMTPTAAPMVLTFARFGRRTHEQEAPFILTFVFFFGYILVWTVFSAGATLAQWGLHSAALISPMMVRVSPVAGGVILIAAGVFQFTPLKQACLHHCRTPLGFMMTEWRPGRLGALLMGLRHGSFCVVCCWLLMALLFVAGVMNLLWIATIAVYVLVEKVVPGGHLISRAIGVFVVASGVWMVAG